MDQSDSKHPSGCPYAGGSFDDGTGPRVPLREDLTYNTYLKVAELLELQKPESNPPHHDEMLFIVIHQAYELWFKLILHEMEHAVEFMRKKEVLRAQHYLNRVVQIQKLLVQQIHLLETMTPADFLEFRDRLMPASGFQSSQFREVEFFAGVRDERYLSYFKDQPEHLQRLVSRMKGASLRTVYYDLLKDLGYSVPAGADAVENLLVLGKPLESDQMEKREEILRALVQVYQTPEKNLPLYLLSESLVEFDEYLALWREHHVRVVERVIGFKVGTGGSTGVGYLRSTTVKKCFPLLWESRSYLEKRGS